MYSLQVLNKTKVISPSEEQSTFMPLLQTSAEYNQSCGTMVNMNLIENKTQRWDSIIKS